MSEDRLKLMEFKSELLNLSFSSIDDERDLKEFINMLKKCLVQHFNIKKCDILFVENDTLKQYKSAISILEQREIPQMVEARASIPQSLKELFDYRDFTDMVLLREGERVFGLLLCQSSPTWKKFSESEVFCEFVDNISKFLRAFIHNLEVRTNEKKFKKLYSMTDLFHSTMDIDIILENVITTIQENYSEFEVELILSNDQEQKTSLKIKQFDYLKERAATVEAFVSGKITIEKSEELNSCILNAPIKGRQAIYGIFQVKAPIQYVFSRKEKEYIAMLTHTAGNALENAKLYHQSHRLIGDLQLINETSHRLNSELDIVEMLTFLKKQLMKSFQPNELCFVFAEKECFQLANASTSLFKSAEGIFYIDFVAKHFEKSKDSLFIADFSRLISSDLKFKSMMAIPMIAGQKIIGFSIVLHEDAYFFSFDSFKLMQSLIHHSSLAISNNILRHKLQEMVDHDHLTKLYARCYLDKFVNQSLTNDESGMFLLLDIDDFKQINDSFGHQVGDQVLIQIGEKLIEEVGEKGICARWGGEELSIYVPNISESEAYHLAKKIVSQIPKITVPKVTVSAGLITWHKQNRPEYQQLFLQADKALYAAKNSGKNKVCIYEDVRALRP